MYLFMHVHNVQDRLVHRGFRHSVGVARRLRGAAVLGGLAALALDATAAQALSRMRRRWRVAVWLLSLALLLLQCALLLPRSHGLVADGVAVAGSPSTAATRSMLERLLRSQPQAAAPQQHAVAGEMVGDARVMASGAASEHDPANNRTAKRCGTSQTDTELPRNRILIIHEQHLQSMGCDVRLLRFVKDLVYLNQEVSMLFRGSTPSKMRQPRSKQLASILHIENFEEEQLRKGLRQPPGIYEWTTAERFAQLMAMGYFNVVIIFLWFWYDPQPSVAELVLPLMRSHAPPDKQPFVGLLSDDAHSIRCAPQRPCSCQREGVRARARKIERERMASAQERAHAHARVRERVACVPRAWRSQVVAAG